MQNAQSHPLRLGVAHSPALLLYADFSVSHYPTHHASTNPGRHWALGWGSIGSTPLKEPLVPMHLDGEYLADEVYHPYKADRNPKPDGRSIEHGDDCVVPNQHQQPTLKAEHTKGDCQYQQDTQQEHTATIILIQTTQSFFHTLGVLSTPNFTNLGILHRHRLGHQSQRNGHRWFHYRWASARRTMRWNSSSHHFLHLHHQLPCR